MPVLAHGALMRVHAGVLIIVLLLAGCEPQPKPLALVVLSPSQTSALREMNTAGRNAFWGWTWHYELGGGCIVRVIRDYEGKRASVADYPLKGAALSITSYATAGFGVKAKLAKGTADLFDADSEAKANSFITHAQTLLADCT